MNTAAPIIANPIPTTSIDNSMFGIIFKKLFCDINLHINIENMLQYCISYKTYKYIHIANFNNIKII